MKTKKQTDKGKTAAKTAAKIKDGKIVIGEVEYEVPDEVAAWLGQLLAEPAAEEMVEEELEAEPMDADESESEEPKADRKDRDRAQATADAFARYRAGEAGRIDRRARLIADARSVLGRHADLDGKPAIEIHRAVVDKIFGRDAPKLDGKSAEYVEATYDHAMRQHDDSTSMAHAIGYGHPGHPGRSTDSARPTLDDLRTAALRGSKKGT